MIDKPLNYEIIDDPCVKVGGFDLRRREWSLLNRFITGFCCCNELLFKWNYITSPFYDCDNVSQSMHHIFNSCTLWRFACDMRELSCAKSARAVQWLILMDLKL